MHKRLIVSCLFMLGCLGMAHAQIQNDSLLVTTSLDNASLLITQGHLDSAKKQINESIAISDKMNYPLGKAKASLLLAQIANQQSDDENGLRFGIQAIDQFTILSIPKELASAYDQVAFIYEKRQTYRKAIENFKESLAIKQKQAMSKQAMLIVEHLAFCHENLNEYRQAYIHYQSLLAHHTGNESKTIQLLYKLVFLAEKLKNVEASKQYNDDLLKVYEAKKNYEGVAISLNNLGFLEIRQDHPKEAESYFQQSLQLVEKHRLSDQENIIPVMINAAVAAVNLNTLSKGRRLLQQALDLAKRDGNQHQIANIYNHLAANYYLAEDLSLARDYVNQAIPIAEKGEHLTVLEESYYLLSLLGEAENKPEKAAEYKKLAEKMKVAQREKAIEARQKQLQQEVEADKQEDLIRSVIANQEQQARALREFALNDERQQKALELKEKELALLKADQELQKTALLNQKLERDRIKLEKDRIKQQLALAEEAARNAEHLQEIELLQKNKQLQDLEKQRKEQELAFLNAQRESDQETIKQQKYIVTAVSGMSILFLLLMIVLIWAYIAKRKSNKQILAQKEVIEERNAQLNEKSSEIQAQNEALQKQNNEINSQKEHIENQNTVILERQELINQSIAAAKLIQQAILPSTEEMQSYLPEHFVIYRPKDVVSGDFYWVNQVDDYTFISAVDCTGHGVPGAFMSMIGNSLLHEIIGIRKILDPALILEYLHEEVNHTLKQDSGVMNIGMDMAILKIHRNGSSNVHVSFAGAKRPLYYVTEGSPQIQMLDPTRRSIGGRPTKKQLKPFEVQDISVPKNSMLYLCSDGYADQSGGKHSKKFGSNQLKLLLQEAASKGDTQTQQALLEDTLDKFMAGHHQRDDILLMGIRV